MRGMLPGYDCPYEAVYLPAIMHFPIATVRRENAICIFEQDTGRPITRHTGYKDGENGAVRGYILTVRSISTVGKYVIRGFLLPVPNDADSVWTATIIVSAVFDFLLLLVTKDLALNVSSGELSTSNDSFRVLDALHSSIIYSTPMAQSRSGSQHPVTFKAAIGKNHRRVMAFRSVNTLVSTAFFFRAP